MINANFVHDSLLAWRQLEKDFKAQHLKVFWKQKGALWPLAQSVFHR